MAERLSAARKTQRKAVGFGGSEELGIAILDSVEAHIAVLARSGEIVAVNAAWRHFANENGLGGAEFDYHAGVGVNYFEACRGSAVPSNAEAVSALEGIQKVLDGRAESFSLEYPCHSPEVERWFTMTVSPLRTNGFQGAVVLHTDITARMLAEQKRQRSEKQISDDFVALKRFHEIAMRSVSSDDVPATLRDIVALAVDVTESDMGALLLLNSRTEELELKSQVGFDAQHRVADFRLELDRIDSASVLSVRSTRQVVVSSIRDSPLFAGSPLLESLEAIGAKSLVSTPLVSRGGNVLGAIVTLSRREKEPGELPLRRLELMARQGTDLIERSHSENELRRSEQRFAQFMKHIPGPAWIKDHRGKYVEVNDAAAKAFGKPHAEMQFKDDSDLIGRDAAARFRENDLLVLSTGRSMQFPETLTDSEGNRRHYIVNKFPLPKLDGEPPLVGGTAIDVTDGRQAEETRRQILEAVSPATGQSYFRALVLHLTRICEVDCAYIAQIEDGDPLTAKTIVAAEGNALVDNFAFPLAESPCARFMEHRFCHVRDSARERFPADRVLAEVKADSYMSITLVSSAGKPIGLIGLMARGPIRQAELAESVLRIVAPRTVAEVKRERAEFALRASEARLRTFLDHAADAIFLHDAQSRVLDVNHQACISLGYTKDELIGMMPEEFDPEAAGALTLWVIERLDRGETVAFDSRHKRKDGTEFPVEVRIRPFWVDGKRFGLSLARDITERKRTEEALRESERRLAKILQHANVGMWDWHIGSNKVVYSREWKSQLGYSENEITNDLEEWRSRVHPDDLEPTLAKVDENLSGRNADYEVEFRMRHKDGSWRWILARGMSTPDSAGTSLQMAGIHLDITEQKQAEAAMRAQVRVLARLATGEPLPSVLEDIVGLVEEQLTESTCSILLLDEEQGALRFGAGRNLPKEYSLAIDGVLIGPNVGSCGTAAYLKKSVVVSDIAVDPLWDNYRQLGLRYGLRSCWSVPIFASGSSSDEPCVLGTFALYGNKPSTPSANDMQIVAAAANLAGIAIERHRAETAIRDSEDRWRTLLENLQNVAVQAFEPEGTITFWNKVSERVYGHTAAEAMGQDIVTLLHSAATAAAERKIMADALGGGELPNVDEYEVTRRDGAKITVLSSLILHRRPGRPPEFFCFDVDVTDKKRAEEELALRQAELAHASRLSTLGQMVAALSHEVAQPLTAIGNYASASNQMLENPNALSIVKLRGYMQGVAQQNQRCTAILQRLRDFSRRARPQRSSCNVRRLIKDSIDLIASQLRRHNVKVRTRISEQLPLIIADRVQLQQVLVNLLTNACDAVRNQPEERRMITIRARGNLSGVEVVVEDFGTGFSLETARRLFEPFFTTKPEGMGIGLNVCETIIKNHGGTINSEINEKLGATFRVHLPLIENV